MGTREGAVEDRGEKSRIVRHVSRRYIRQVLHFHRKRAAGEMQPEEIALAGLSLAPPDGSGRASDPDLRSARLSPPARTVRLLAARVRTELGRHCTRS